MKKTRIKKQCLICGKEFEKHLCRLKVGKGKYCSTKCSGISKKGKPSWNKGKKLGPSKFKGAKRPELSGENHWNWKGGVSSYYIRTNGIAWKNLRKQIYKRDNWLCQKCGKHCYKDIQCHHIIPYRFCEGNENKVLYWNITINSFSNLITLCRSCHVLVENKTRKENERDGKLTSVPGIPLKQIYA